MKTNRLLLKIASASLVFLLSHVQPVLGLEPEVALEQAKRLEVREGGASCVSVPSLLRFFQSYFKIAKLDIRKAIASKVPEGSFCNAEAKAQALAIKAHIATTLAMLDSKGDK